jgi:hypothetical protein
MHNRIVTTALLLVATILTSTSPQAQAIDLRLLNWTAGASDSVAKVPFKARDVANFLWTILNSDDDRRMYESVRPSNAPAMPYSVADFVWIDLDGDSSLDLVAMLSTTPREVYNEIVFVRRVGGEFLVTRTPTADLDGRTLDRVILRDTTSGILFLVPTRYATGTGPNEVVWLAVYQWGNGGLVDVSDRHPDVYEGDIPDLRTEIASLQAEFERTRSPLDEEAVASAQMVLDRILRVTRQDVAAPIRHAADWASSRNLVLRRFALTVLETFPDSQGLPALRMLARDPDRFIRERAGKKLQELNRLR